MSWRDPFSGHGRQGDGVAEAYLLGNVWSRYVVGFIQRPRSHVCQQACSEAGGLSCCRTELQGRDRSADACHQLAEERPDQSHDLHPVITTCHASSYYHLFSCALYPIRPLATTIT